MAWMSEYLILASNFNEWAGPNNHLLDLCNYLHNDAHINIKLVTHENLPKNDFLEWVRFPIIPILKGKSPNPKTRIANVLPNAKNIDKIIRSLKLSPNKVFVNSSIDTAFSTFLGVEKKIKIGYNVLGNNPQNLSLPLFNLMDRIASKTIVNKILAHTETHKKGYLAIGVAEKKIQVIPHCIDIKRIEKLAFNSLNEKSRRPIIFYCGRLAEEKGVKNLLDSYEQISRKIESTLVLLGKGP